MPLIDRLKCLLEGKKANPDCRQDWEYRLYTPTVIERYGKHTFIVDCWHHRIIYSADIAAPIERWNVLTDRVGTPHSIASDGTFFLTEDSVRSKILVFRRKGKGYVQVQELSGVGSRPHRILYDNGTSRFYGISAYSGELFILENRAGRIMKTALHQIEMLKGYYTRSLRIIDGSLYVVSGPGRILKLGLEELGCREVHIESQYNVPFELWIMNDIMRVSSYYYISSYQNGNGEIVPKLVRIRQLEDLESHKYEDIYDRMGLKGVPYFFSFIGD